MKIRETAPVAAPQRENAPAAPAPDAHGASSAVAERISRGATSAFKKSVGEARAQAAVDRQGRIRDLAQAVRGGSYRPDARDIAGAMLDTSDLDSQLGSDVPSR